MTDEAPKPSLTRRLKREADELILQLSLGKVEAADYIEQQKARFAKELVGIRGRLEEVERAGMEAGGERARAVKQKIDELALQLALGRMESGDAYQEQCSKITGAISGVREAFAPVEERAGELLGESREIFEAGAKNFRTKLDALALTLGVGGVIAGDELKRRKEIIEKDLAGLSTKLVDAAEVAEEGLKSIGHEALDTFDRIRAKLRGE